MKVLTSRCVNVRREVWSCMPPPPKDEHLVVGPSWISTGGLGLFAAVDIPKQALCVCSYTGQEHTFKCSQRLQDKSYLNRVSDELFVDPRLCPKIKARYINDCINPYGHNVQYVSDPSKRCVQVKALRDIARGEELFISYGDVYWDQQEFSPTSLSSTYIAMRKRQACKVRSFTR